MIFVSSSTAKAAPSLLAVLPALPASISLGLPAQVADHFRAGSARAGAEVPTSRKADKSMISAEIYSTPQRSE